jgi:hypothetical protein
MAPFDGLLSMSAAISRSYQDALDKESMLALWNPIIQIIGNRSKSQNQKALFDWTSPEAMALYQWLGEGGHKFSDGQANTAASNIQKNLSLISEEFLGSKESKGLNDFVATATVIQTLTKKMSLLPAKDYEKISNSMQQRNPSFKGPFFLKKTKTTHVEEVS